MSRGLFTSFDSPFEVNETSHPTPQVGGMGRVEWKSVHSGSKTPEIHPWVFVAYSCTESVVSLFLRTKTTPHYYPPCECIHSNEIILMLIVNLSHSATTHSYFLSRFARGVVMLYSPVLHSVWSIHLQFSSVLQRE
jgi:hypothetical protein